MFSILLIVTNFFIILLIAFHIIACRRVASNKLVINSPQMFLIKSVLYMNMPLSLCIFFIGYLESRAYIDIILMLLFGLLVFNCLTYVYFHFFNMSETARRIKILIQLYQNDITSIDELKYEYNPSDMISSRLERLLEMGEITVDKSGGYHINSKILLPIANAFSVMKKLIS